VAWRNDDGLVDRVVIVTGAGGGIGRAVCEALDEAGARIFAVDVSPEAVGRALDGLRGTGHSGGAYDLADLATHSEIISRALQGGTLAALAHLAAVLRRQPTVDDITEDDWDAQLDVNLKATFFLNRAVQRAFVAQGTGGAIVNFASQGWWTGGFGGSVVYSASKGGIVSMSRGLARSFAPSGVRVNVVSPGAVDTPMLRGGMSDEALESFVSMIPLGRLADPSELAGSVLFLASGASSYITGALINVSGGQLMY
jgi:NAD(P)-dependent dehydrogenase (short-subunit alcohol dehydrogenase family)